jgi:FMN-dependent NADH-azoreductase
MKLLHIDSSILGQNSVSRTLSAEIVAQQRSLHPGLEVTYRDLAAAPSSHLSAMHVAVAFGAIPEGKDLQADLAEGEAMIDELLAADIVVIGAPMYNFAIPSQLKAWIDRVLVRGRTFHYTEKGPEGLLPKGKKAFIASARGGFYTPGSPAASLEHHESYLKGALGFIGLDDVTVIRAEGIGLGPEARDAALAAARKDILALAA